jgi:putative membrane protein insertion efficiency factor
MRLAYLEEGRILAPIMRNLFVRLLQLPVRFYRVAISPFFVPSCRYVPSCSAYMLEAMERHGAVKGLYLGLRRLSRCHPWHKKTCAHQWHDPVPNSFDYREIVGYKDHTECK